MTHITDFASSPFLADTPKESQAKALADRQLAEAMVNAEALRHGDEILLLVGAGPERYQAELARRASDRKLDNIMTGVVGLCMINLAGIAVFFLGVPMQTRDSAFVWLALQIFAGLAFLGGAAALATVAWNWRRYRRGETPESLVRMVSEIAMNVVGFGRERGYRVINGKVQTFTYDRIRDVIFRIAPGNYEPRITFRLMQSQDTRLAEIRELAPKQETELRQILLSRMQAHAK